MITIHVRRLDGYTALYRPARAVSVEHISSADSSDRFLLFTSILY